LKNIVIYILIIISFSSCKEDSCFSGTGENATEVIELNYFHTLNVESMSQITLIQDTSNYCESTAGSNILSQINYSIKDSVLTISSETTCYMFKKNQKPNIKIHFKDLSSIAINRAASLLSEDTIYNDLELSIEADMVDVDLLIANNSTVVTTQHKAGGLIKLSGYTNFIHAYPKYTIQFNALYLNCREAILYNGTNQEMYIGSCNTLKAITKKHSYINYISVDSLTPENENTLVRPYIN